MTTEEAVLSEASATLMRLNQVLPSDSAWTGRFSDIAGTVAGGAEVARWLDRARRGEKVMHDEDEILTEAAQIFADLAERLPSDSHWRETLVVLSEKMARGPKGGTT